VYTNSNGTIYRILLNIAILVAYLYADIFRHTMYPVKLYPGLVVPVQVNHTLI